MIPLVALLRGINVGGSHTVPMSVLREVFDDLGFDRPETYIQSGNVLFGADGGEDDAGQDELCTRIAAAIERRVGFAVPVVVRSAAEIGEVLERMPFGPEAEPKLVHVVFLGSVPTAAEAERLDPARAAGDPVVHIGREIYVHYRNGSGRSAFTAEHIGRVLGRTATARNLNTVAVLHRRLVARTP